MKVNEIERLLARYYDGETSDTEEKELKRFFTEEDVPAHLLAEKESPDDPWPSSAYAGDHAIPWKPCHV